jgi:hypothetical protein
MGYTMRADLSVLNCTLCSAGLAQCPMNAADVSVLAGSWSRFQRLGRIVTFTNRHS